ncbi:hypothetical protein PM082_021425 [Marasmius tenuissimus]|nr:hypothetical protein PM082_021425 [Marasmius tenuissimus]
MISFPTLIYLATVAGTVVFAKPTPAKRQTSEMCTALFNPDEAYDWNSSQGIGFTDGVKAGSGIIKVNQGSRLFKFTKVDSSPTSYFIRSFDDQNLAVGLRANQSLFLTENKNDENTKFIIECTTTCEEGFNDGCFMKFAENPNRCVQIGQKGAAGEALFVADACEQADRQRFNYFRQQPPSTPVTSPPVTTSPPTTTTIISTSVPTAAVCNPNFESEGVRVANSAVTWGAPSFDTEVDLVAINDFNERLEIRFEQTGSPNPYYVAKSLNGTNLAVAVRPEGSLFLTDNLDTNDARHKWTIECKAFCKLPSQVSPGDLSADGCTIKSAFDNKCVQLGDGPTAGSIGDRIFVNECDGTDSQRFNFLTSPF